MPLYRTLQAIIVTCPEGVPACVGGVINSIQGQPVHYFQNVLLGVIDGS